MIKKIRKIVNLCKSSVTHHLNTCNIWYMEESMESLQNSFVRTPFSANPFLSYPVSINWRRTESRKRLHNSFWECGCGRETVHLKLCWWVHMSWGIRDGQVTFIAEPTNHMNLNTCVHFRGQNDWGFATSSNFEKLGLGQTPTLCYWKLSNLWLSKLGFCETQTKAVPIYVHYMRQDRKMNRNAWKARELKPYYKNFSYSSSNSNKKNRSIGIFCLLLIQIDPLLRSKKFYVCSTSVFSAFLILSLYRRACL